MKPSDAKPSARRSPSWRRKLVFALVPLSALLLLAELGMRTARAVQGRGSFWSANFRVQRLALVRASYPVAHDPMLGYVPRAHAESRANRWNAHVSIDARTMRRNGVGAPPPATRGVLAVGDSFTFGDQVSDDETWPAGLEQRLAVPVWNGGVFGYSFAQAVLRAEQLLPQLPVDVLVLSFIADDLRRCEFSTRYAPTPWFDLVDGELVLRGVPVPERPANPIDRPLLQHLLGHSALLDALFWNAAPMWWVGDRREVRAHPPGTGVQIATRLLDRLAARCTERSVRLLLVLQGYEIGGDALAVLAHAHQRGVPTLDLVTAFAEAAKSDPSLWTRCFDGHMTAAGNAWVAVQLAVALGPHFAKH